MKIAEVMTSRAAACRIHESLHRAAELMWSHDCGCLPVVDDEGRPIGMVTDRDICMAAWSRGQPLQQIEIASAMSPRVIACSPDDAVETVHARLREHQLHRLPVIDGDGRLAGIVSLSDLAQAADRLSAARRTAAGKELAATLGAITRPRNAPPEPTTVLPAAPRAARPKAARPRPKTGAPRAAKKATGRG